MGTASTPDNRTPRALVIGAKQYWAAREEVRGDANAKKDSRNLIRENPDSEVRGYHPPWGMGMRNAIRSLRPIGQNGRAMARPFRLGIDRNRLLMDQLNNPGYCRRSPFNPPGNGIP